jgi:hypothetical protein
MNHEVDAGLLIDLQNDVLFFGGAKASRLYLDRVDGRAQPGEEVFTMLIGVCGLRDVGAYVRDGDRCFDHNGPALISHRSAHLGLIRPLAGRCRDHQNRDREQGYKRGEKTETRTADTHGSLPERSFILLRVKTITFVYGESQVNSEPKVEYGQAKRRAQESTSRRDGERRVVWER